MLLISMIVGNMILNNSVAFSPDDRIPGISPSVSPDIVNESYNQSAIHLRVDQNPFSATILMEIVKIPLIFPR